MSNAFDWRGPSTIGGEKPAKNGLTRSQNASLGVTKRTQAEGKSPGHIPSLGKSEPTYWDRWASVRARRSK